jgi:hypothetical protein
MLYALILLQLSDSTHTVMHVCAHLCQTGILYISSSHGAIFSIRPLSLSPSLPLSLSPSLPLSPSRTPSLKPQAVDDNNAPSGGASSDDPEFEDQVQRFMTLNSALRNVASKANALILAVKAQGEASLHNIELLEATCELQFGEEAQWTSWAVQLRHFNQQVHGEMNT